MDLVEVSPDANPPVVRLMDFGKWRYEQSVRNREARKKQGRVQVKEVKFKSKIDEHDYQVKRRRIQEFLEEGHKVKTMLTFYGREITRPELGRRVLERLQQDLNGTGTVEMAPRMEGRLLTMLLAPDKRARTREEGPPDIARTAPSEASPEMGATDSPVVSTSEHPTSGEEAAI